MPAISFSGLASGIDGDAVIKAVLDSRRNVTLPLKAREEEIRNESKALDNLNAKLLSLRGSLEGFLTLAGGGMSKRVVSSNEEAVSAVVSSSANLSTVTVAVSSLAKGATLSLNDRFPAIDQPIAPELTSPVEIVLTVGSGESREEIRASISNTTTLSDVAAAINTTSQGGIRASTVNVGTTAAPAYLLLLSSREMGVAKGSLSLAVPPELRALGIFSGSTIDPAEDAVFTVSGIGEVRRPTNAVSDLIPGVTLQLKRANTGPVNLSIVNDGEKTAESFQKFVDMWNEIVTLVKEESKIERLEDGRGVTNRFGSLARTRLDERLLEDVRGVISSVHSGVDEGEVRVLADLGLTIQRDGTYAFDRKKFSEAARRSPVAVERLTSKLADELATTNGVIARYIGFQGQIDLAKLANEEESKTIARKLESLERSFSEQEKTLRKTFADLESTMSRLNASSDALLALIESSGRGRRR